MPSFSLDPLIPLNAYISLTLNSSALLSSDNRAFSPVQMLRRLFGASHVVFKVRKYTQLQAVSLQHAWGSWSCVNIPVDRAPCRAIWAVCSSAGACAKITFSHAPERNKLHQQTFGPFPLHETATKTAVMFSFCSRWNLCACFGLKQIIQWVCSQCSEWQTGLLMEIKRVDCSEKLDSWEEIHMKKVCFSAV